jgi:hypothetical protein
MVFVLKLLHKILSDECESKGAVYGNNLYFTATSDEVFG